MREVKTIQDQCTWLHGTNKMPVPCSLKRLKGGNRPLALHLHEPRGRPANSAVTLPGTSFMTQAGHGTWMCFVGPQSIFKNILISCQHLKTQRFYMKVWISSSS